MSDDPQTHSDAQSVAVIDAATIHATAIEESRKAQLDAVVEAHKNETKEMFVRAMREVLTQGDEGTKSLLIQKIPLLCADIMKMKGDLFWIKWLLMGMVAGVGLLTVSLLANLAAK